MLGNRKENFGHITFSKRDRYSAERVETLYEILTGSRLRKKIINSKKKRNRERNRERIVRIETHFFSFFNNEIQF